MVIRFQYIIVRGQAKQKKLQFAADGIADFQDSNPPVQRVTAFAPVQPDIGKGVAPCSVYGSHIFQGPCRRVFYTVTHEAEILRRCTVVRCRMAMGKAKHDFLAGNAENGSNLIPKHICVLFGKADMIDGGNATAFFAPLPHGDLCQQQMQDAA